jgi:organic hydroperoxide reductase OsmC/OhrA
MKTHQYHVTTQWTGNKGEGTKHYTAYERAHEISVAGKPIIPGSSDPSFRGDKTRYNPEEMFVSSLSSCHMLWFLHFCATEGVVVTDYIDNAEGYMTEEESGNGHFSEVILKPVVTVADAAMIDKANALHHKANKYCFIANSCNFPVTHVPVCTVR